MSKTLVGGMNNSMKADFVGSVGVRNIIIWIKENVNKILVRTHISLLKMDDANLAQTIKQLLNPNLKNASGHDAMMSTI